MLRIIVVFSIIVIHSGFLLNGKDQHTSNGTTGNQCLTSYDKALINQDIEKVRQEQKDVGNILGLLTSQIHQRFSELEREVKSKANTNQTCKDIERKLIELQQNNTFIVKTEQALQNDYNALKADFIVMKNKTVELNKELETLRHLASIDLMQNLASVNKKLSDMDASISTLKIHDQSKSQDFLSLYNITKQTQTRFENYQRQTFALIHDVENQTRKDLQCFEAIVNITFASLKEQTRNDSQRVALTAFSRQHDDYQHSRMIIQFEEITTQVGLSDLSAFISNGEFTCTSPGLYLISVSIMSSTIEAWGYIMRNSFEIGYFYVADNTLKVYNYGTVVVATNLNINDTVYIQTGKPMNVYAGYSCFTIIKIK